VKLGFRECKIDTQGQNDLVHANARIPFTYILLFGFLGEKKYD